MSPRPTSSTRSANELTECNNFQRYAMGVSSPLPKGWSSGGKQDIDSKSKIAANFLATASSADMRGRSDGRSE
jgi:hypothetical protein